MNAEQRARDAFERLRQIADPEHAAGAVRYGVRGVEVLGIRTPDLRTLARELGMDQALAEALWRIPTLETRALAGMVADPEAFNCEIAERWAADFDSWALVDGTCFSVLYRCPFAYDLVFKWAEREEEFVRRAAFSLMAKIAISHKTRPDSDLEAFYPLIERHAGDGRNFVKKAVNWALRQIGKRNAALNASAIEVGERLLDREEPSARWIARDALRELRSEPVRRRLGIDVDE